MKRGFALLEFILTITMTVVIASIVLVYIVNHSNNASFKPMYIKTISTLKQTGILAKLQYDVGFSDLDSPCPSVADNYSKTPVYNGNSACRIFNGILQDAKFQGQIKNLNFSRNNKQIAYKLVLKDVLPDDYNEYYAYLLSDGVLFAFNPNAQRCSLPFGSDIYSENRGYYSEDSADLKFCIGFIDVNGIKPPNKEVLCSSGENLIGKNSDCIVDMTANNIADVYPVIFYNSTVEPLSSAAKFVFANQR